MRYLIVSVALCAVPAWAGEPAAKPGKTLSEKDIQDLQQQAKANGIKVDDGVPWHPRDVVMTGAGGVYVLNGKHVLGFDAKHKYQWNVELPYLGAELKSGPGGNLLAHAAGKGRGGVLVCLSSDGKTLWKWEQSSDRIGKYEAASDRFVVAWTHDLPGRSNVLRVLDAKGQEQFSRKDTGPFYIFRGQIRTIDATTGKNALLTLSMDGKVVGRQPVAGTVPFRSGNPAFVLDQKGNTIYTAVADGKARVIGPGWSKGGFSPNVSVGIDPSDQVLAYDGGEVVLYDTHGKELYRGHPNRMLDTDEQGNFVIPKKP
jgi:hypothetical protein